MVTRLSDGLTPGDGSDPRTFPSIWNATAGTIESQGSAITAAEADIDTLQSDVTAAESDIDALEAKNIPSFGTATPSDGDVLTFDSGASEYVPEAPAAGGGAVNNLLYNGAMQVAQRGTSEAGITGSGYFTADRWQINLGGLGTWTQTVEADGPTGSGFTKSLKMECTTADAAPSAGDLLQFGQAFEGQDLQVIKKGTADAESLTLSFWVKSNVTGTYVVYLFDNDNSRMINAQYSVSASGTWEQKSITFAGDTSGALDNDNANSFAVRFGLGAGSNFTSGSLQTSWAASVNANLFVGQTNVAASSGNYWQVTGVQLETGTVATGFDHKSYGVELAECQRYFEKVTIGNEGSMGVGNVSGSNDVNRANFALAVPKRASASLVDIQNLQAYSANLVSDVITIGQVNNVFGGLSFLGFDCQPASFAASAGQVVVFINTSGSSEGYISVDAEL